MKLLHVINSCNPVNGGPIEGISQLGKANRAAGHTIEVVSMDSPEAECVKTFPLPIYALGPKLFNYGYSSRLLPWLRANHTSYDAIIVNGIWQYHGLAVWQAVRHSRVPYVVFTHGMLDPWFKKKYPLKHLKKSLYWHWGEYRVLRDAAGVMFTCEEERVLARQSFRPYDCNEVVVNYGTSGPDDDAEVQLETFYQAHPNLRGKRVAMFLGRLHEKKGCDLLIEAFAQVLSKGPEWHLLICGPDQVGWKRDLVALVQKLGIENRISWVGMVRGAMKWGALRASEIFVLPSHQENFGIVVAEALACGTPVLISNKVNIWHEIEQDGAGIVAEDSVQGTCSLLSHWLKLPDDEKMQMRKRARSCFERRFEIHVAARTMIERLQTLKQERIARNA